MRIERRGPVARLTPRLQRFFVEALGGVAMDDLQDAQARKADYKCLKGLLVVELKSLDQDGSERMDNLVDELQERPDWPIFYGSAPAQSFLKHIRDPEPVQRRIVERIGRAIENHVHKANKQLAAHEAAFPRKNMVKTMVLANEDHEIYEPELVAYIVQHVLARQEHGKRLYPHIDALIFLSERHATTSNGWIAFAILCIESVENARWKRQIMDLFLERWSRWSGAPVYQADRITQTFTAIEHVPETMRRQELWELEYRRNPYMQNFTTEMVRERFDEAICISSLAFVIDSPLKPARDAIEWSMATMSHLMLEMAWRAVPVTDFPYEPERLAAAARRLRLPPQAVAWFERDMGRA